ncbi:MAG: sugar transferase, partial [Gammaproteobacteria bacterium]|nr:sugar transferase [Gammaproteobacteria bacterium]
RRYKLDELPQLWNVLIGNMSFVGPRPDVAGFLDRLEGDDREILKLRPGITGPASIRYRDEEEILAGVDDPERTNIEVIWPDKVRINREYLNNWSFRQDIKYILDTLFG